MTTGMNDDEVNDLVEGCLKYMRASKMPMPLPATKEEYAEWRKSAKANAEREANDDAEDAWFELDRLIAEDPVAGWRVLIELAARCDDEQECSQLAAGPLSTFLRMNGVAFSTQIDNELKANPRFRSAYNWLLS